MKKVCVTLLFIYTQIEKEYNYCYYMYYYYGDRDEKGEVAEERG